MPLPFGLQTLHWSEKSAEPFEGSLVCDSFSLAAFKIFSLSLTFVVLIMYLGVSLCGFISSETPSASYTWTSVSFFRLVNFPAIISSDTFYTLFCLSSSSGTPIMWILVCSMLFHRSLKLSPFLFIVFFLLFQLDDFYYSVFHITYVFFCVT